MSSPTYANIILLLTQKIDALTQSFIFNGYQALSATLAKPLASLCVLLICLMGYGLMRGIIKMPLREFSKLILRIGLVYMLAMNWGFFSDYVVKLFIHSAGELGATLMKATPFDSPMTGSGINSGLQSVFIEVIRVGAWTWNKASFKHWAPIFTAMMIYFSGLAVVGFALFEIVIAKLMLSICLCTAPLFLCFTLSDKTQSFFDRWLGTLVGFSLVLVFVSSVIGLSMHLIHWTIGGHYASHAANVTAVDWIPIFIVACLCVMAIKEVVSIAKSIGGACCTSQGSAMVGGFIGGALGASRHTKSLSKKAMSLAKGAIPAGLIASVNSNFNSQQLRGNHE